MVLGGGAALENVVPPIPADTFVLAGAFLAARGAADAWVVFLVTWLANVGSALGVYGLAWRYGESFFDRPIGHMLLRPDQLKRVETFYGRWGVPAIFFSRFLPAFRAVVPVFAGVSKVPVHRVGPPVAIASGLWYGGLVYAGAATGRNLDVIVAFFDGVSTWLMVVAGVLIVAVGVWWWRTRSADG